MPIPDNPTKMTEVVVRSSNDDAVTVRDVIEGVLQNNRKLLVNNSDWGFLIATGSFLNSLGNWVEH